MFMRRGTLKFDHLFQSLGAALTIIRVFLFCRRQVDEPQSNGRRRATLPDSK